MHEFILVAFVIGTLIELIELIFVCLKKVVSFKCGCALAKPHFFMFLRVLFLHLLTFYFYLCIKELHFDF